MMNSKALKKQLAAAIAMVVVAGVALSSSTYAWFVNNTSVTAEKVDVTAATAYSLLISDSKTGVYSTSMALNPANVALTPVSTLGYRAAASGTLTIDSKSVDKGDILFVKSNEWDSTTGLVKSYTEVCKNSEVTLDSTTTKLYYTDSAFLKATQKSNLYLDKSGTGINWVEYGESEPTFQTFQTFLSKTPVTPDGVNNDAITAYNTKLAQAQALLKTLRVGFKVTQSIADKATTDTDLFYVYQLAASDSYIIDGTISQNTSTDVADGNTKGVGPTALNSGATTPATYAADQINNYSTGIPVLNDAAMATAGGTSLATPGSATSFATINPDEIVQVDIYVWMEGCDYDTVSGNLTSFKDGGITGLQFGFCVGSAS